MTIHAASKRFKLFHTLCGLNLTYDNKHVWNITTDTTQVNCPECLGVIQSNGEPNEDKANSDNGERSNQDAPSNDPHDCN